MAKLDALHKLYLSQPPVRELFDSILEHGVEDERTTVEALTEDGSLARRTAINMLRELAELGCGEFKVGRKGHPSRLEWSEDPRQLVAGVVDFNGSAAGDEPEEVAAEEDDAAPEPAPEPELAPQPEREPSGQRTFDLGEAPPASASTPRRRTKANSRPLDSANVERIEHVFVLRPDTRVRIELPADLSAREAEVLAGWIGSLSFER